MGGPKGKSKKPLSANKGANFLDRLLRDESGTVKTPPWLDLKSLSLRAGGHQTT